MQILVRQKLKPIETKPFLFVDKNKLRGCLDFTDDQLKIVRKKLPTPIYYFQVERKYYYNLELVKHFFLVGAGDDHDRLVQEYLGTLPKVS